MIEFVQQYPHLALLPLFVGLGAGLLWVLEYFDADRQRLRALRRIPLTTRDDAAEGSTVKVAGRVELVRPLRSPYLGNPCCAVRAFESQCDGYDTTITVSYRRSVSDECAFMVVSDALRVLVTPTRESFGFIARPTRCGVTADGWERYEWSLTEGAQVTVVGVARHERPEARAPTGADGYRGAGPRLVMRRVTVFTA